MQKKVYDEREIIFNAFKNQIFPMTSSSFSSDDDDISSGSMSPRSLDVAKAQKKYSKRLSSSTNKLEELLIDSEKSNRS